MRYSQANARLIADRYIRSRGMTRAQFADKVGIKPQHLSRWFNCETNGKSATDKILAACAKIEPVKEP